MTQKIGLDQGNAGLLSEAGGVDDCESQVGDGSILPPISVNIAHVVDGQGLDLWIGARRWAKWVKANPGKPVSRWEVPSTAPIQVPGQVWMLLYKAGVRAVRTLGRYASMEAMEEAGSIACVRAYSKLVQRIKDSAEPRPREQWLGVKRTKAERANDDNPCLIGKCPDAQRGLHWKISVDSKGMSAARLALTLSGEICPLGLVVRHKCGAGGCINATHTHWGTIQENNRDKYRDGTAYKFGRRLSAAECAAEWAKPLPKELSTAHKLSQAGAILRALPR